MMSVSEVLSLKSVSKQYPLGKHSRVPLKDFWALQDISLGVRRQEILGVIGRNGAGKTTLLNIMAQVLSPTAGEVVISGKVLGLFNLGVGFQDELSGRENIFLNGALLGASRRELEEKLPAIVAFSELGDFMDMPLGTYSQGMRLRLGFSIIVHLSFDVLVIDEVLAVGDALFQSKCYQRLADFKRDGKTLVFASQGLDLIERFCDRVVLLDHGRLVFQGPPDQGISHYRILLNTEKFFVGPVPSGPELIENTKKWAEDRSVWGRVMGTQEVVIQKVEFQNRWGVRCRRIRSGQRLKIKVSFRAKNKVSQPHFGVAIFREDGVYGYGPNTEFDQRKIREIREGRGYFILDYHRLDLAPGSYRLSIAVWDRFETVPFTHHEGCYPFTVVGSSNPHRELSRIPVRAIPKTNYPFVLSGQDLDLPKQAGTKRGKGAFAGADALVLKDGQGHQKNIFMTQDTLICEISLGERAVDQKGICLWTGLYREDGVYCQGVLQPFEGKTEATLIFPKCPLLPGKYIFSLGLWDEPRKKFIFCDHGVCSFQMVSRKQDHGTVYLEHDWKWRLPS